MQQTDVGMGSEEHKGPDKQRNCRHCLGTFEVEELGQHERSCPAAPPLGVNDFPCRLPCTKTFESQKYLTKHQKRKTCKANWDPAMFRLQADLRQAKDAM